MISRGFKLFLPIEFWVSFRNKSSWIGTVLYFDNFSRACNSEDQIVWKHRWKIESFRERAAGLARMTVFQTKPHPTRWRFRPWFLTGCSSFEKSTQIKLVIFWLSLNLIHQWGIRPSLAFSGRNAVLPLSVRVFMNEIMTFRHTWQHSLILTGSPSFFQNCVKAMDKTWHSNHFSCYSCDKRFSAEVNECWSSTWFPYWAYSYLGLKY